MDWPFNTGVFSLIAGLIMIIFWKYLVKWQIYTLGKGDYDNTEVRSMAKFRLLFAIVFLILMGIWMIYDSI